jgi:nucleotide-binding universal stress UspA family protein
MRSAERGSGQGDDRPRIVVGVDGFESSTAALRWAIHHAKLVGATVEAVTAWHVPAGTAQVPAADRPDYAEDARMVLAEAITQTRTTGTDVEVRPRVVAGGAAQVLVDVAEGADLLVVGCQGHGAAADTAAGSAGLGSVGEFCAHHAPCPVVIMRGKR